MNNNMKTILVTGCLGTIGIKTINYLLENTDYNIIGIDNCISNPKERVFEIINHDRFKCYSSVLFTDPLDNKLKPLFEFMNVDCILHLASLIGSMANSVESNSKYFDNNEKLTLDLLNYCVEYKISKFIFASSSSVYGNQSCKLTEDSDLQPLAMYGITKVNSEKYINYYHEFFGLNTVILRYTNVVADIKYYGYKGFIPLMVDKIVNDEPIKLFNNGQSKRQYIFIDNIAKANYLAIENDNVSGETFNITVDEEPISLITACNYIYSKLNKNPNYTLYSDKQFGDIDCNWMSNSKAKEKLGFEVITDMYSGIDKYIDYATKK